MSNGQICVLYSPDTSVNGAKLPLNKGPPRKATIEDMSMPPDPPRPGKGETDLIREWIRGGAKPRRRGGRKI